MRKRVKDLSFKKAITSVMAIMLLFLAVACNGGDSANTSTAKEEIKTANVSNTDSSGNEDSDTKAEEPEKNADEIVTLSGFVTYSNLADVNKAKWYMDILRDELGIELDFQSPIGGDSNQIMQALMASGELPDIVGFKDKSLAANAVNAGLLLNLDENKDTLPSIFENTLFDGAVKFYRDQIGGDDNQLYLLATSVGEKVTINLNPQIRYDVYQDIGMPEITTLDDYIDVLKQMMEAYPETPEGQKTYGLTFWSDWDNKSMSSAGHFAAFYGYDLEYISNLLEIPADGSKPPTSILDDDSMYKKMLKFFFDANQAGIVDPDSITQKWDAASAKYTDGRIFFSPWDWAVGGYNKIEHTDADEFTGFASVWAEDFQMKTQADMPVGTDWTLGIGASTKQKDAALKYINYIYSYEGVDIMMNGPQGGIWDLDEDGIRYITEDGWNIIDNGLDFLSGGKLGDASAVINSPPITEETMNPATKEQTLGNSQWDSHLMHNKSKLITEWRKYNDDAINMNRWAEANGRLIKTTSAVTMMEIEPDDLQTITTSIGDVVKTNSWQMVFAKDEAEFESLWVDMQTKANGLGMEQVVQWTQEAFITAQEQVEKYK